MSFGRCDSEPVLRRKARDPAEQRFLHFLDHYSQKHRPLSRAQIQALAQPLAPEPDGKSLRRSGSQPLRPKSGPPVSPMTAMLRRPSSAPQVEPTKMVAIRQRALSKIAIGLHVALLNAKISQKPGEIQLVEPIGKPRMEQVHRIYRQFLRFKTLEADRAAEVRLRQEKLLQEAWCDSEAGANRFHLRTADHPDHLDSNAAEKPLSRLRWATLIQWLEQEASCGMQQTYRRAVAALLRGVKLWRQLCASREQAEGISLGLLLSWAFPSSSSADIADMLLWLAQQELEMIRKKSPRLIDEDERKQLERIFNNVYAKGRAYITADDIAGGAFPDRQTQLMTLVDGRLARHVFGEKQIDWLTFLEHMCEMGCQGHPNVTRLKTPEGKGLARCQRDTLNFRGWLSETPSDAEVEQRKVIDALEAEVIAWRAGIGY